MTKELRRTRRIVIRMCKATSVQTYIHRTQGYICDTMLSIGHHVTQCRLSETTRIATSLTWIMQPSTVQYPFLVNVETKVSEI